MKLKRYSAIATVLNVCPPTTTDNLYDLIERRNILNDYINIILHHNALIEYTLNYIEISSDTSIPNVPIISNLQVPALTEQASDKSEECPKDKPQTQTPISFEHALSIQEIQSVKHQPIVDINALSKQQGVQVQLLMSEDKIIQTDLLGSFLYSIYLEFSAVLQRNSMYKELTFLTSCPKSFGNLNPLW